MDCVKDSFFYFKLCIHVSWKKKTRFNCIYVSFEHDNICGKRDDFKILLTQKLCYVYWQAFYNWAIAISDRAKMRGRTKEAEELWKQVGI
jgi:hypothetical protein